ncbi:MAG: DUF1080 domain-containing protein [Rhodothermales bacterium]
MCSSQDAFSTGSAHVFSRCIVKAFTILCCAALLSVSGCSTSTSTSTSTYTDFGYDDLEFERIFNGENLDGWRIDRIEADEDLELFTIEDGELILDTPGTEEFAWLTFEEELTDYVLRLKFIAYQDARGNCGVQFRDVWPDDQWYGRHGFDLASNVPESTGFIWDFEEGWLPPYGIQGYSSDLFEPYLPEGWEYKWSTDEDPWNLLEMRVEGSRVTSVLNGKQIIDWDGGDLIQPNGHIAIEVHNGQVFRFRFKDIELARLG